jgi:hypothetical protein
MQPQVLTFDGYAGKFAPPTTEGVREAFEFLNAAGRSPQVYARLYEKVEESVRTGLFWGIWKETPNASPLLIASSAIFLHGKAQIPITQNGSQNQECGTYVEHGATLRRHDREGTEHPKGVFLQILMAAPLTQLFLLAGQEMAAGQGRVLADVVVDNVQEGRQSDYVRNFIRSAPHCWEELKKPSTQLLRRFESSVDDPNVNRAKGFNRFFIHAVPAMAGIVSKALEDGVLSAEYKGVTYQAKIDLSGLPQAFKEALPVIGRQTAFFASLDKRTSFTESRRLFEHHLAADRLQKLSDDLLEQGPLCSTHPPAALGKLAF